MILGISSFTYGWAVGVEGYETDFTLDAMGLLAKMTSFDLHCLQLGDNLPLHNISSAVLSKLKSITTENKIRLEIGARKLTPENIEKYITFSESLQAPLLRFVTDAHDYEPSIKNIIELLQEYKPTLEEKGITLGLENHDRLKVKELAHIMNVCNSPNVGVCLDCVNSMGAGEGLEQVVRTLAPYTVNIHIKDFTVKRLPHKMGFTITGAIAGQGMSNIPWVIDEVMKYQHCESAILEQWVEPENNIEKTIEKEEAWAEEGIRYLKQLPYFTNMQKG